MDAFKFQINVFETRSMRFISIKYRSIILKLLNETNRPKIGMKFQE